MTPPPKHGYDLFKIDYFWKIEKRRVNKSWIISLPQKVNYGLSLIVIEFMTLLDKMYLNNFNFVFSKPIVYNWLSSGSIVVKASLEIFMIIWLQWLTGKTAQSSQMSCSALVTPHIFMAIGKLLNIILIHYQWYF